MKINKLKNYWWVLALISIFLISYYIRVINVTPDKLLSFDPIFQYRYTKYLVDWGHLPLWDELTYYVGRAATDPPFMHYLTALIYWLQPFKWSLMTTANYASALYGALLVFAAFLLGKELSNKYGGLFSAILIGTAPQILIRTFGASYDTDQLVLFFLILNLYLGYYALKKKSIASLFLALIGFTAYMLTWSLFIYPLLIIIFSLIAYFILRTIPFDMKSGFKWIEALKELKPSIKILALLIIGLLIIGFITNAKSNLLTSLNGILGFALTPEVKIVNISIAELQPFSIFNLQGWITAMGNFVIGDNIIDTVILIFFFFSMLFGIFRTYKNKDMGTLSFLLTLFIVGIYTTIRGIRFTEFTSALFIIVIGSGFGLLLEYLKEKMFLRTIAIGIAIISIIVAVNLGLQVGKVLGPDINSNWDNAWTFLKTQTPEMSLVGTWWDPGHMIAGIADRRNFADGAHCSTECYLGINDRITDLGKIMVTSDENESLSLIRKYQGVAPKVYWIASDDLIGKFQWLQYFGTGCDARSDNRCPLYIQLGEQSRSFDNNGNIILRNYGDVIVYSGQVPIPILTQGINAALFDEIIFYNGTQAVPIKFTPEEKNILIAGLKPLEQQLNVRFTNQSIPMTVWIPPHYQYIVVIPQNQRNDVFTKMFFLEGQGLEHFKQVFRNEQVKIYEVI